MKLYPITTAAPLSAAPVSCRAAGLASSSWQGGSASTGSGFAGHVSAGMGRALSVVETTIAVRKPDADRVARPAVTAKQIRPPRGGPR